MERITHVLRRNEATTIPQYLIFFDTETVPRKVDNTLTRQDFHLGVACYWRIRRDGKPGNRAWLQFDDIDTFWDWALHKASANSTLFLVSHNLAFDAMVLQMFPQMPRRGWRFLFQYEDQATRLFKWGYPTKELVTHLAEGKPIRDYTGKRWAKTILMLDNCNLFKGSIEGWGKQLGFPKLTMPPYEAPDVEWWPYCKRDVEIMVKLWEQWFPFLEAQGLGSFHCTIGAQAFAAFRHSHMVNKIEIHTNEKAIGLERGSYFGGRTAAFYVGRAVGGPFYKLDVNSMYPFVMHTNPYPVRLHTVGDRMTLSEAEKTLTRYGLIATVKLDCDTPLFPVKQEGRNIYPVGQLTTTLTTPEVKYALHRGWIKEIGSYATYRMRPIFHSYVESLYALKIQYEREGDTLRRNLIKVLLNSLYGKFGQVGYQDRIIGTADPEQIEVSHGYDRARRCPITIYTAGGLVIEQIRTGEGYNSFVAIPAHVTAYARLYLWQLIEAAGRDNVYYCDTDSLIVSKAGYDGLTAYLDPVALGGMKVEGIETELEIYAPKDYRFGAERIRKGVPDKALEIAPNTFEMETWPGLLSHLAGRNRDTFYNRNVTKTLTYTVDWGELQADGWVKPYWFGVSPLLF